MSKIVKNYRQVKKWQSIIDNAFKDLKYLIPFIVDNVAY